MTERFQLAPSHREFLRENIPEFAVNEWETVHAGRAGSERCFVRVQSRRDRGRSYVLIVWDSGDNDWPRFLGIQEEISRHLGVLPAVFASDERRGLILEEDLGGTLLRDRVLKADREDKIVADYERVLDTLLQWHALPVAHGSIVGSRQMDIEMFSWESGYFATHCAAEYFGINDSLNRSWEHARKALALRASSLRMVCMHRDFQSENIMIERDRVRFVDFQGARRGPAEYDLASLLYDPYVDKLNPELVDSLFAYYAARSAAPITREGFCIAATQRLLQALGAYCNLTIHKGKHWYREFIPIALERLSAVAEILGPQYAAIKQVVDMCREVSL